MLAVMKLDCPYVQAVMPKKGKGRVYTYYRRDGSRMCIDGESGSTEWLANYDRIHQQYEETLKTAGEIDLAIIDGAVAWLVGVYRFNPAFKGLKPRIQTSYDFYLRDTERKYG